jgi:signal transduction histidine kinase
MDREMAQAIPTPGLLTIHLANSLTRSQAQHSSITFCADQIDKQQHCVSIDVVKVAQAFRNIVSNAFEHTPAGGHITIRTVRVSREKADQIHVCEYRPDLEPSHSFFLRS